MKDNKLQTLLHAADAQEIADFPASSEQEKERIFARMQAKRRHLDVEPAESETFVVTEAKRPKMHFAAIGVAACMVGVLGVGGFLWMNRPADPLHPGMARTEQTEPFEAAAPYAEGYTPFGDITDKRPWFTVPLTDADWANPKDAGKMQEQLGEGGYMAREYFIDESLLPSLQAVFENYGWTPVSEEKLTDAQKAEPTKDFIIMHLATDPENHGGEYLTACFNFGGGIIRVDTADGTTYYEMDDGELKRCMNEIIVHLTETEYEPIDGSWFAGMSSRFDRMEDTPLSGGQKLMLEQLFCADDWYMWSMYYALTPDSSDPTGTVYQIYMTNGENATEKLVFYPDSQCVVYLLYDAQDPTKIVQRDRIRPADANFFDNVNALLYEGVYQRGLFGDLREQNVKCTDAELDDAQCDTLNMVLGSLQLTATQQHPIGEPVCTLTYGDGYSLRFFADRDLLEWQKDGDLLECFNFPYESYEALYRCIYIDGTDIAEEPTRDTGAYKQPFMSLMLSSAYTTFTCHNAWENGKRFGVELPDDETTFTADLFRLQELFDEKEWITADIPNYNWRPGYITMHVGEGDLFIGTTPIDNVGNYVLLWKGHSGSLRYYYADESFITQFVQILAETQQETQLAESPEMTRAADAARRFLDQTAPEISAGWDCRNVSIVMQLPSDLLTVADEIPDDASYYLVEFYSSTDPSTIGKIYVSLDGTVIGGPPDYFPGIENTEDTRWVIYD